MFKVLVPLASGFEEIETVAIADILRRGGIQVTLAGLSAEPQKGSRRVMIVPDTTLDEVSARDFDAIVVPGGRVGVEALIQDGRTVSILQDMKAQDKYIAAICAAPLLLDQAGVIVENTVTSYPGVGNEIHVHAYSEERVVIDGKVITSRSPGTAVEFALTLVKIFEGAEKADKIADLMLAERVPGC